MAPAWSRWVQISTRLNLPNKSPGVAGLRAWDDPHDRAAIMIGTDLYRRRPTRVYTRDVLNAVIGSTSILKRPYTP